MRKHILARTRSLSRTVRTVDSVILPRTHKSTVGLDVNVGMCVFSTRVYICIYIHICECVQRNRNNKKKKRERKKRNTYETIYTVHQPYNRLKKTQSNSIVHLLIPTEEMSTSQEEKPTMSLFFFLLQFLLHY